MLPLALLLFVAAPPAVRDLDITTWTPEQLWTKSDEFFHGGDYPASIYLLRRVIELDPEDVEAYNVAAWLTWSQGDEPTARQLLELGVARNPAAWEAVWELGFHLYDRVHDPVAALPLFQRAAELPERPDRIVRSLAHCYLQAEQPSRAVALWNRLQREHNTPQGIIDINLPKAVEAALSSAALARSGNVFEGPADPRLAPVVLHERFEHPADETQPLYRVIDFEDPADIDGEVDYRIAFTGRQLPRVEWHWTEMLTDRDDDGTVDEATRVADDDGDGVAETLPPLAKLLELRQTAPTPTARLFLCPDRYELGVGADGAVHPVLPRVTGGKLTVQPHLLVLSDRDDLALRLVLRNTVNRQDVNGARAPLPGGAYAANDPDSQPAREVVATVGPDELPGAGRYAIATELVAGDLPLDRRFEGDTVLEYDGTGFRLVRPGPWDTAAWRLPPPMPMPDAGEPGSGPGPGMGPVAGMGPGGGPGPGN